MFRADITKILFLDVETVPQKAVFSELSDELARLWEEKFLRMKSFFSERAGEYCSAADAFESNAGIYAEFGKIVCISVGIIYAREEEMFFRTKSFAGTDEKLLLEDFSRLVNESWSTVAHRFCGHNIKEFDIPYICRRMMINKIPIPSVLNVSGKKPWETNFIDTLELWKFGDKKNYSSLKLLCEVLGVDSPKDDIDGSEVSKVYYHENNIERIADYCQKDVFATAQIYLRLSELSPIDLKNLNTQVPGKNNLPPI